MSSIAGKLLSMAEQLSPMRRFYKFVVRRLIGPYIKYDLDLDQLEIKLGQGTVRLYDVQLNPVALNLMLARTGTNLRIASGTIAELSVSVPWRNLMNQPCRVCVRGVRAVLSLGGDGLAPAGFGQPEHAPEEEAPGEEDHASEGVQVLEQWIEGVLSRLQLEVHDLSLRVDHCSLEHPREYCSLALTMERLEYRDTTAENRAPGEVPGGDTVLLRERQRKEIKFCCLQLRLSQDCQPQEPLPLLCTANQLESDDYVCVVLDGQHAELSFFLQSVQCRLDEAQLTLLAEMAALATKSPPEAPPESGDLTAAGVQGRVALSQSLEPGDFRTIEHILSVHEGVELQQLEQQLGQSQFSVEESKLFYSTIGTDSDVFCSFMQESASPPASPGMQEPAGEPSQFRVSTRLHVERVGLGLAVRSGSMLLLESKLVCSSWVHAGLHGDLKLSPLKLFQCTPDGSQDTILLFGALHDMSSSSLSSFMQDSAPQLQLTAHPGARGTTHLELATQHLIASLSCDTVALLSAAASAVADASTHFSQGLPEHAPPEHPREASCVVRVPSVELNYGEQLRLGLTQMELHLGGDTQVLLDAAVVQVLLESEESWSRVPTTVLSLSRDREQPVSIQVRSNQAVAPWSPPGRMSHQAAHKLAMQAAAVASSPVFVHATVPQLDLSFTTHTYRLFLKSLLGGPDPSAPQEPPPQEPLHGLSWSLLLSVARSGWELREDEAPELARTATLPDKLPATYTAQIQQAGLLFVAGEGPCSWLSAQFGELLVWEARAGHEAKPVLTGGPRCGVDPEGEPQSVLSLNCGFGVEEHTDQLELLFRELVYEYHVGSMWVLRVQDFLVPPSEPQPPDPRPPQITKLILEVQDVSVHHQPLLLPAAVLLHVGAAQMESSIIDQCPEVLLWVELSRAQGFLARQADTLAGVLQQGAHKESLEELLGMHSVVPVAQLTEIEATVNVGGELGLELEVRNPKGGELKLSLCADSCGVLVQLVTHWVDAVDVGGLVLSEPLSEAPGMADSMLIALLGDIDPLAFAGAPGEHPQQDLGVHQEAPFVIDDFYQPQAAPGRPRATSRHSGAGCSGGWLQEPYVCDDYFNTRHADNEALKGLGLLGELDQAQNYPRVVSRVTLSGLNLTLELFGGFDWAQQLPASTVDAFMPRPGAQEERPEQHSEALFGRDPSTMLRLELLGGMARYWEFEPRAGFSWRLAASVQDLELYDCLAKSAWKKFLTRSRRFGEQHGSRAMLRLEIDALHPDIDKLVEDWRFKLALVPLKLNIDQDALDFLVAFLSFEADLIEAQEDELAAPVAIFFQSFELASLQVCIDYKAKHFDLGKLREGHYEELANLLSLEGMELTLDKVQLQGVSGWADIGTGVLCAWAPSIWEAQIHRYAQSVQPIRSASNLASGMFDLIYLPLCDERSVLRGAQRGTVSCAWKVSLEVMSVAARMAVTAQIALEHVRDTVAPGAHNGSGAGSGHVRSKFSNAPGSIGSGLTEAYSSLSRGLQFVANSLVKRSGRARHSLQQGYTASLLQGVLGVGISTAEAASKVLIGVRNTLDPTQRIEAHDKYK